MADVQGTRVAVVAGGTGYVGSAIAKRLAADGMRVAALSRSAPAGDAAGAYQCDLRDAAAVTAALARIEAEMGPLAAAVYAAGDMPPRVQLHLASDDDLRAQFETNVFGAFHFFRECAARLKARGQGVLIGITTAAVATPVNTKARGVYSPVKFAQQGILAAFKEELAAAGVRVYSVAPGVMPGGLNSATPQAFLDMVRAKAPGGKLAEGDDVAAAVSYLCSPEGAAFTDLTMLVAPETGAGPGAAGAAGTVAAS